MFESISRSFELMKASLTVLRKDKEIMLFPLISGIICLITFISIVIPALFWGVSGSEMSYIYYIGLFLYYIISYFIIIFFNTGLIACAHIRFKGGDPKFRDGINAASKNIKNILIWALISATVGIILRMLSERAGILGKIVIGLIGMAWNLLTFFVIPIMIFENKDPIESIKKSGVLFKKTWGENVIGNITIALFMGLLAVAGIIIGIILLIMALPAKSIPLIVAIIAITLIYVLTIALISAALEGIYKTALYIYAEEGKPPKEYTEEIIKSAFKEKGT